jgi:hypothetical protein
MTRSFYYVPALLPNPETRLLFRKAARGDGEVIKWLGLAQLASASLYRSRPSSSPTALGGPRCDCRLLFRVHVASYVQVPAGHSPEQH